MLSRRAAARADHRADHQRRARLATEHVAKLRSLIEDLIKADTEKIGKHQLRHRPQSGDRRPRGRAHDGRFGDRRVDHTVFAELLDQALGDAEHAAGGIASALGAGATRYVLADNHHARIAAHLVDQRFLQCLANGLHWHGTDP
jgi:hypothetical protein